MRPSRFTSCCSSRQLGVLDALIAAVGRRLGWTRPVAWLGPLLAVSASALFTAALLPGFGAGARDTQRTYAVLERELAEVGAPLDGSAPVIHDFPIWLAEAARVPRWGCPTRRRRTCWTWPPGSGPAG